MINAAKRIRKLEKKEKMVVGMDNVLSGKKYNLHS